MSEHVYKSVEITGSSAGGLQAAIDNGVAKAAQTLRNLDWVHVTEIRGQIEDGGVHHYQVTMKVGFRLED